MLYADKKRLTKEIVELKHNGNQTILESLIKEWVDKMKSKYSNKIDFSYGMFNGNEFYVISIELSDNIESFYVSKTKSESAAKAYLDELERTIILVNELDAQNVLGELKADSVLFTGNSSDNHLYTIIYSEESNKSISLHLEDNDLVSIRIREAIYNIPQYKVELPKYKPELIGNMYLKPKQFEDGYSNQLDKYAYELISLYVVNIDSAVQSLKLALKNFDETQSKYVKSAK